MPTSESRDGLHIIEVQGLSATNPDASETLRSLQTEWKKYSASERDVSDLSNPVRNVPKHFDLKRSKSLNAKCPVEISNMIMSSPGGQLKRVDLQLERQTSMPSRNATVPMDDKIIMRREESDSLQKKQLDSYFVYTSAEAICALRERLSVSACNTDTAVALGDLSREFERTMSTFYPDGVRMTKTEIEEANENFTEWKNNISSSRNAAATSPSFDAVETVEFRLFEEWFTSMFASVHNIVKDRLLDYTLQQVLNKKKKTIPNEAPPPFLREMQFKSFSLSIRK